MRKLFITCILYSCTLGLTAQVGINTNSPTSTLHVDGDVIMDNALYLENPSASSKIRNSNLLISLQNSELVEYDINVSKYGPINYTEFVFRNLSADGLQDYDTKISIDDYIVTVQGYYYLEAGTGDTDVMTNSNNGNDNIEGHQIYAYKNTTTNTWFIRAFINDAVFKTRVASVFLDTPVDMYLNLIIYRRGFISKELNSLSVDMGNMETGTAPLPAGF